MTNQAKELIKKAYKTFNSIDVDKVLSTFHSQIQWPKALEGIYVTGHDEIR